MKQKTIEERFHLARNDPSLVVIEGFHTLKHAIWFGAELLEVVSPDLRQLAALQSEYAPDIALALNGLANLLSQEVFGKLAHVEEQPFTRSVGGLEVKPDEIVIIRAHMKVGGYGGAVMKGTVAGGFASAELPSEFASDLETQRPLPADCAF